MGLGVHRACAAKPKAAMPKENLWRQRKLRNANHLHSLPNIGST
jgi:hypothetical protein